MKDVISVDSNSKSEDTSLDNMNVEEAIKDGLSNHTGEWFNGWIVPGLNLTEEQLRDLLFYITKSRRLKDNILAWHKAEIANLLQVIEDEVNNMYELSITDLELRQHQQGVEIPVLGKTELLGTINKIKDNVINGGSL